MFVGGCIVSSNCGEYLRLSSMDTFYHLRISAKNPRYHLPTLAPHRFAIGARILNQPNEIELKGSAVDEGKDAGEVWSHDAGEYNVEVGCQMAAESGELLVNVVVQLAINIVLGTG